MTNEGKGGLGDKLNWVTIIGDGSGGNDGGHMSVPDHMLLVGVHQGLCWWWICYSTKSGGCAGGGCGTPPRVVAVVVVDVVLHQEWWHWW